MAFVKEFNARTTEIEAGRPVPVVITYYADKSFSLSSDAARVLLPQEGGGPQARGQAQPAQGVYEARQGSRRHRHARAGARHRHAKMKDLNAVSIEAAMQTILGSAKSMGIEVKG
jgi:large subunit ribosomal protein L11